MGVFNERIASAKSVFSSLSDDNGLFYVEFVPQDVGTYIMDVYILGQKIPESPIFYKVYDSGSVLAVTFFKVRRYPGGNFIYRA